jgi:hypothetical protein
MVAGLSVQVLSLLLFMTLSLEFGWRVWTHKDELNIKNAPLYHSLKFKVFLYCKPPSLPYFHIPFRDSANNRGETALALATLTIFTRSVFRVAELSGGFGSYLANDEVLYMILEGAMIVIASTALTVMHPGIGFGKEAWEAGDWHFRTRKEVETSENSASGVKSESGAGNATGE